MSHCLNQHSAINHYVYKKSVSLVVRAVVVFLRFREMRENDCITYYPRFVKSTKRHGIKQKQNVSG